MHGRIKANTSMYKMQEMLALVVSCFLLGFEFGVFLVFCW